MWKPINYLICSDFLTPITTDRLSRLTVSVISSARPFTGNQATAVRPLPKINRSLKITIDSRISE